MQKGEGAYIPKCLGKGRGDKETRRAKRRSRTSGTVKKKKKKGGSRYHEMKSAIRGENKIYLALRFKKKILRASRREHYSGGGLGSNTKEH